jgi:hypothetical protein|nr:MAG TPA: hypothetical protein [Caudoviricetes sp.]
MTVKEWLARPIKMKTTGIQELRPRLYCYDGYSVSVQASELHYCSPRINGLQDYQSVELGFPSEKDELINEYADYNPGCESTVYGYVPIEIVEKLIEKHGGIRT